MVQAVPVLFYCSETWIVRKMKAEHNQQKCLQLVKGYTRQDRRPNRELRQEVQVYSVREKMKRKDYQNSYQVTDQKEEDLCVVF
jgi:hypothetical protein